MPKQQQVPHHSDTTSVGLQIAPLAGKGLKCLIQAFLSPWGPNTRAASRLPAPTPKQKENSHQGSGTMNKNTMMQRPTRFRFSLTYR
eukprot:g52817.t1